MNWPNEFDGAHTLALSEEELKSPLDTLLAQVARMNLEAIAKRIEEYARSQTTYPMEEVAMHCAAIVRGAK